MINSCLTFSLLLLQYIVIVITDLFLPFKMLLPINRFKTLFSLYITYQALRINKMRNAIIIITPPY